MSLLTSVRAPENRLARMAFSAAAGALLLSVVSVAIPAGAQDGECTVSLSFENAHLLNNGFDDTAGPFEVDLEAGTYTIVIESSDDHDVQVGIAEQPVESFHLVLDSGYRSAATNDVPQDGNTVTTVFTDQVIEASSSLVLEHARVGNVNSVFADSVCFIEQTSDAPDAGPVDCVTQDVGADAADDAAPAEEADTDAAGDAGADADDADADDADAGVEIGDAVPAEVCDEAEPVTEELVVVCTADEAAAGDDAEADVADDAAPADGEAAADGAGADADADAGVEIGDAVPAEVCDEVEPVTEEPVVEEPVVEDPVVCTTDGGDAAGEDAAVDDLRDIAIVPGVDIEIPGQENTPVETETCDLVEEVPGPTPDPEVIVVETPAETPEPIVVEVPGPTPDPEVIVVEVPAAEAPAEEVVIEEAVEAPAEEVVIEEAVEAPEVDVEVAGVVEQIPVVAQAPVAQGDAGGEVGAVAAGGIDGAAPQLALTGASEAWKILIMISVALMAAGALCMRWGRAI